MAIVSVQRPSANDVTRRNPLGVIFVNEEDETEGALRIIPDTELGTEIELQRYSNGVWNDTGLYVAASTIYMNHELQLSAGGENLLTSDLSSEVKSLLPRVPFDSVTGTGDVLLIPKLSTLQSDVILQPDDTGEISGSTIQFEAASTLLVLANTLLLRTGAAATDNVRLEIRRDSFSGTLFYGRNYPASDFPANSDVSLVTDGLVELRADGTSYVTFTSDGTLTLKADITNTTPYYGANFYQLTEETVTPNELGGALSLALVDNGDVLTDNDEIMWEIAA